jgi:uncharacterized protein
MHKLLLAAAALCCLTAPALAGPSFNCNRASFPDEFVICSDQELSRLDRDMAVAYAGYMTMFHGGFRQYVRDTQAEWLHDRHLCSFGKDCIANAYAMRWAFLGDGDIALADWCHDGNHFRDIDCRGEPWKGRQP